MRYGIPYKGSKSKIAEEIIKQLPAGNRLVDLFGGGAVQGDHIDIFMEDHDRVEEFGVKYLHVYIVKEVEY